MMKNVLLGILLLTILVSTAAMPARSETSGTWMGTVAYINRTHVGVKSQATIKDFLLPSDFTSVYSSDGSKIALSDVTIGTMVRITYVQSTVFGSTRVSRIDLVGITLPMRSPNPLATVEH